MGALSLTFMNLFVVLSRRALCLRFASGGFYILIQVVFVGSEGATTLILILHKKFVLRPVTMSR